MVSPFLPMPADRVVAENALAFAIRDGFPVSAGHTLVITKRLVPTWFEATREEQLAILELVDEVKAQLDAELRAAELECEGGLGASPMRRPGRDFLPRLGATLWRRWRPAKSGGGHRPCGSSSLL